MEKKAGIISDEFHHANLYYIVMLVSMVLCAFFAVQAVRFHIEDEIYYALGFYTISCLLLIIAVSSHTRGKGHYHYHRHIPK